MWTNKTKDTDNGFVMLPIVTGDLVFDGKQMKELLSLAKHLVEDKQSEFVNEIKPLIDVGIIVERQDGQRKDGGYAFVHWADAHVELRHTKELVKFEMMESFIEKNLVWHL